MSMATDNRGRGLVDKDPNAVLDYTWNWADWLDPVSDTIASVSFVATGVTVDSSSIVDADTSDTPPVTVTDGGVRAFISGGTAGGAKPTVVCRITTAGGRIDDRTIVFNMRER